MFAERVAACASSPRTLRERHGVEAHVADGSVDAAALRGAQARASSAGEFPVLCLGPVGARGPQPPERLGDRATSTCRGCRPASSSASGAPPGPARGPGYVQTYIPYIRGGGIEHVVSVLAPRGAEHHQILDSFEGVKRRESTIATQLGAITGQVAASKDDAGYAATAARLRVAAAVFGA